jgi:hypothetical protein
MAVKNVWKNMAVKDIGYKNDWKKCMLQIWLQKIQDWSPSLARSLFFKKLSCITSGAQIYEFDRETHRFVKTFLCETENHRLNMKLDLQSLFWLHVHGCTRWLRPRKPPSHAFELTYTRALLVRQDRRHLFVTLCLEHSYWH